ncbi:MAG: UDP-N-acetylmuramoyl-L-alanyl-D-glutamate--2,6-diaminopimelate ligase [Acidimicrobiales bacterium]|nr:UDP-N-acetylmuramoyl-L-alanyl-D-glutamate--2,6-diaminopimelate ligase [Acidimicrobiales bacterium]
MVEAGLDLADLAEEIGGRLVSPDLGVHARVFGITHDSRTVESGVMFACVPGAVVDGHDYAEEAAAAGAVALLTERELNVDVPQLVVPDVRRSLGPASAAVFDHPDRDIQVVGVTGTNGKTTVTHMLGAMLAHLGRSVEVLGTLSGARTTPEAPELFARLADMRARSVSYLAMEVSSHALELHRVDGLRFSVGAFTNLSRDHLDFHPTMEAYFESKARLFGTDLSEAVVINEDDPAGQRLIERRPEATKYGIVQAVDLKLEGPTASFQWRQLPVTLQMAGEHNVYNALCAASVLETLGFEPVDVADAIGAINPVPGRMEWVAIGQPFRVVVDYSHTPDSLRAALIACRFAAGPGGKVRVVFGCGGNRDASKRPLMGTVAAEGADQVFVTSDNPRLEDPLAIIEAILAGIPDRGSVIVEPDRQAAIDQAVAQAAAGDVVLIAGKGHETTQTIGSVVVDFDDRIVAVNALQRAGF